MSTVIRRTFAQQSGGVFKDGKGARAVAGENLCKGALGAEQVQVVSPEDQAVARKPEPEEAGIARALAHANIALALAGLMGAFALAVVLLLSWA